MTEKPPSSPDTGFAMQPIGVGGKQPNPQDPSRVGVGFPAEAVEALRVERDESRSRENLNGVVRLEYLDAVLAWMDRYVPRQLQCRESTAVEVGGIYTLMLDYPEDHPRRNVDLIRVNGRAFVPETPVLSDFDREMTLDLDRRRVLVLAQCAVLLSTMAGEGIEIDGHETATLYDEAIMALGIEDADDVEWMVEELIEHPEGALLADRFAVLADDGDPTDAYFRLGEALGELDTGGIDVGGFAFRVEGIIRELTGAEKPGRCRICGCTEARACNLGESAIDGPPCGWADATRTLCDAPNCLARAAHLAHAAEIGAAYARDASGRPVHIGEDEPTAGGLFPGDPGYVRPL